MESLACASAFSGGAQTLEEVWPHGLDDPLLPVFGFQAAEEGQQERGVGRQAGGGAGGPALQRPHEIRVRLPRLAFALAAHRKEGVQHLAALRQFVRRGRHPRGQRRPVRGQAVGELDQLGMALHHAQRLLQQLQALRVVKQPLQVRQLAGQQHALGKAEPHGSARPAAASDPPGPSARGDWSKSPATGPCGPTGPRAARPTTDRASGCWPSAASPGCPGRSAASPVAAWPAAGAG